MGAGLAVPSSIRLADDEMLGRNDALAAYDVLIHDLGGHRSIL